MLYEIEGASNHFDVTELDRIVLHAIRFLAMPDDSFLTIRFSDKLNVAGYCDEVDIDEGWVEIELNNNLDLKEAITTIFHEMVHCRQILEGRLVQGNPSTWDGVEYDCEYMDLPWEIEAYNLEGKMYDTYTKS